MYPCVGVSRGVGVYPCVGVSRGVWPPEGGLCGESNPEEDCLCGDAPPLEGVLPASIDEGL